jgi:membrane associated rhomboid family serine protease
MYNFIVSLKREEIIFILIFMSGALNALAIVLLIMDVRHTLAIMAGASGALCVIIGCFYIYNILREMYLEETYEAYLRNMGRAARE